jgi:uncharacterized iron-regulated membrane protein
MADEAQVVPANGGNVWTQRHMMGEHATLVVLSLLAVLLASFAISLIVLIRLPEDYLSTSATAHSQRPRRGVAYWIIFVPKTLIGVTLIVIGVLMPVPGEGLLTIFAGLSLLEFPGKRRLFGKVLGRSIVLHSINRVRTTFLRPPLTID